MRSVILSTILLAAALISSEARATGGISGSKLAAPCADTVPARHMELEPYFAMAWETGVFGAAWRSAAATGRSQALETGYRFTLGLTDRMELGLITPIHFDKAWGGGGAKHTGTGLGDLALGTKWRFFDDGRVKLAFHGGFSLPTGDHEPGPSELPTGSGGSLVEAGLIGTFEPLPDLTIDVNLQGAYGVKVLDGSSRSWEAALQLAAGYAFGSLQLVLELNQYHGGEDGYDRSLYSLHGGITYEVNDRLIIVTGPQWDFAGRNESAGIGYGLAFTILI